MYFLIIHTLIKRALKTIFMLYVKTFMENLLFTLKTCIYVLYIPIYQIY